MDKDSQGAVTYDSLETCLNDQYPLENVYLLLKNMDKQVLKRMHAGGTIGIEVYANLEAAPPHCYQSVSAWGVAVMFIEMAACPPSAAPLLLMPSLTGQIQPPLSISFIVVPNSNRQLFMMLQEFALWYSHTMTRRGVFAK